MIWWLLHKLGVVTAVRVYDCHGYSKIYRSTITPNGERCFLFCGTPMRMYDDGTVNGYYAHQRWERI